MPKTKAVMPERTIAQRVDDVIGAQFGVSDEEIAAASTLEELGSDSLEEIELCIALEEEFNIEISDEKFERLHSLQELRDFVEKKSRVGERDETNRRGSVFDPLRSKREVGC